MKKVYIIFFIFFMAIVFGLIVVFINNRSHTIEEILNIDFNQISYIKVNPGKNEYYYNVEDFVKEYKNNKYVKFYGSYGSTTNISIVCYDSNDKVIFTLIDIGNRDLIYLTKGVVDKNEGSKKIYQLK